MWSLKHKTHKVFQHLYSAGPCNLLSLQNCESLTNKEQFNRLYMNIKKKSNEEVESVKKTAGFIHHQHFSPHRVASLDFVSQDAACIIYYSADPVANLIPEYMHNPPLFLFYGFNQLVRGAKAKEGADFDQPLP